jgi:putative Mg2+ transporter-C (MgtC) family protein
MHDLVLLLGRTLHATPAITVGATSLRLVVAALLGGCIGVERQLKHRPAGLRTNMFICFGAALFTVISGLMSSDDTRIAAQIISGIGFIGGGVILHSGSNIQGVTTAATIFVVAAIGMCTGAGLMVPATIATALAVFVLLVLGILEQHVFINPYLAAYHASSADADRLYSIVTGLEQTKQSRLLDVKLRRHNGESQIEFTLQAAEPVHERLRKTLNDDFHEHKIVSFSSSKQE